MEEKKTKDGRNRVEIDPLKIKLIYKTLPEYKRDRPISRVVDDLLAEYLDTHDTLGSERERASSNSYRDRGSLKGKGIFTKNLDLEKSFNNFWSIYRSAEKGVSSASKTKAKEEFKKAVTQRNVKPSILVEAASKAVNDQKLQIGATGDCLCLPDAFRWLRDDMWESLIESVTVKQQVQTGIQIYD